MLSTEKDDFCVRFHTVYKDFRPTNLPTTSDFLIVEDIGINCRHLYNKNVAVTIALSQRTKQNNGFSNFELIANEFIKKAKFIPFSKTNTEQGYDFFQIKDYKQALEHLNQAIVDNPKDYQAYFYRAFCFSKQEKYSLAISNWEKTISLKKNYVEAYANLAAVYKIMKKYQKALFYADKAINTANNMSLEEQIKRELPVTYKMRGQIQYELKNNSQAIQDLTKAIDMDPKLKSVYMNRGYVYYEQGDNLKASQDFEIAGELFDDDAVVLNNIAWFYATCKDKQYRNGIQAVSFSLKSVGLEANAVNLDTLGAAYVENEQYEKAIETYKAVIEKDSTFVEVYQKSLNEKECYSGPIDGAYSLDFEKALRRCIFQGHYL